MSDIILSPFRAIAQFLYFLYPLEKDEIERTIILFALFFLVAFVYNTLLPLKKTIILNTPGAGAEAITYLKPFVIAPCAFLFTWYFLFLLRLFNRDQVFFILIATFAGYFLLYTFVFRPYEHILKLDSIANWMNLFLPASQKTASTLVRYWMHTLFYAFAELWSTTVFSLLLWGFVNEISTERQAKTSYALLTAGANLSSIFSSMFSKLLGQLFPYNPGFFYGVNKWEQAFFMIMSMTFLAITLIFAFYGMLVRKGHTQKVSHNILQAKKSDQASIVECFIQVFRSPQLLFITIIVMGYYLVYNLSDVIFNKKVHMYFQLRQLEMTEFMYDVQFWIGVSSTVLAVVTNLTLIYVGWTFTALLTPVIYGVTALFFYVPQLELLVFPSLTLFTLYAGGAHISLTKGAKYSFFDSTKEMAYIGLTPEERANGKAAIDGIASRFGKSGGSFILIFLLWALNTSDINHTVPYVFMIICAIVVLWLMAVVRLGAYRYKKES
jgi:AAA family ATP:ADP antiporter